MQQQQNYQLLGGDPRLTLDGLTGADLQKLGADSLADVLGVRLFDTRRFKKATAFPKGEVSYFTVPVNQKQALANDSATEYLKTRIDTNNKHAGQLPRGVTVKVMSLQARLIITNTNDTAETAALVSDPTPLTSDEVTTNVGNLIEAFMSSCYVEFKVGGKTYEEGLLEHFPAKYGVSGFAGAADEAIVQNGFGRAWNFPIPRWIDAGRSFEVLVTNYNQFTVTRSCKLRFTLECLAHRSIQ
jgi:hypothetical protein